MQQQRPCIAKNKLKVKKKSQSWKELGTSTRPHSHITDEETEAQRNLLTTQSGGAAWEGRGGKTFGVGLVVGRVKIQPSWGGEETQGWK